MVWAYLIVVDNNSIGACDNDNCYRRHSFLENMPTAAPWLKDETLLDLIRSDKAVDFT